MIPCRTFTHRDSGQGSRGFFPGPCVSHFTLFLRSAMTFTSSGTIQVCGLFGLFARQFLKVAHQELND